jgi:hypothetical protein
MKEWKYTMINNQKIIPGIIAVFLLVTVSSAMAVRKEVSFQHKKSKALQIDYLLLDVNYIVRFATIILSGFSGYLFRFRLFRQIYG